MDQDLKFKILISCVFDRKDAQSSLAGKSSYSSHLANRGRVCPLPVKGGDIPLISRYSSLNALGFKASNDLKICIDAEEKTSMESSALKICERKFKGEPDEAKRKSEGVLSPETDWSKFSDLSLREVLGTFASKSTNKKYG